ncbi:ATP-binding protein [Candidatus Woesearchaeota archaeon]|nr:ATP-binding protein [Candidatus Woesearchaeota archaeon]
MVYNVIVGRDKEDREKYGERGLILLGKTYVKMGRNVSLSNPLFLDIAKSHVILVTGKRGSGKSHSLGVIAESIANLPEETKQKVSVIILDTMGIFWSMKFPNERDAKLLKQWNLEPKALEDVQIYTPEGYFNDHKQQGIPVDFPFSIRPNTLTASDWVTTFNLDVHSQASILITRVLKKLMGNYSLHDIIMEVESDQKATIETKNLVESLFEATMAWGLFSEEGELFENLAKPGKISIIDISCYSSVSGSWSIKSLVAGLVAQKLLQQRMMERKKEELKEIKQGFSPFKKIKNISKLPQTWLIIDECHQMLPKDKITPATNALISLLREGRQPGISMILATQQPGKIHDDVITQSDIVLSHRLTAKQDIDALNEMMQSYMQQGLTDEINQLPRETGAGIILDDTSERIYPLRVRPKLSWHAGSSPSAVEEIKKEIEI